MSPGASLDTPHSAYWRGVRTAGLPDRSVRASRRPPSSVDAVAGASHLMRHRGPDEPGTWSDDDADGSIVLGFNRLSIIDIAHSHQPLRWGPPEAPDRYVLVFNGEIYNYLELRAELAARHGAVFATDGDGEAIVAAYHHWGADALTRLRGMFAFALWDTGRARVVLRARPVRHQAAVHGDRPRRHRRRQREEVPAGPRAGRGHRPRHRRARRAALHGAAVRARTRDAAPRHSAAGVGQLRPHPAGAGAGGHPVLRAQVRRGAVRRRRASRAATTRSPRCSRTRSPSTCAPTSPSARSCPAESTRRPSRRWPCGTTRG